MASKARWLSLCSYSSVMILMFLMVLFVLQVPRYPLPREDIASLTELARDGQLPGTSFRIRIALAPGVFDTDATGFGLFISTLRTELNVNSSQENSTGRPTVDVIPAEVPSPSLRALQPCADATAITNSADGISSNLSASCLTALEAASLVSDVGKAIGESDESNAGLDGNSFDLLVTFATELRSTLLLSTGFSGVLRYRRHNSGNNEVIGLAHAVARELRRTWLREATFERTATLFEIAPSYVFSFFLVGDCHRRVAWDFVGGVVQPYLQGVLDRLRFLFDLEVDAQVVQCGSLNDYGRVDAVVDASALKDNFLKRAGEWPGDTLTRDARWLPPLLHFAAFKPSSAGLSIVDVQRQPQQSFAVQGWGAVALTNVGGSPCETRAAPEYEQNSSVNIAVDVLSDCEAARVTSAWLAHLRSWLLLSPIGFLPPENEHVNEDSTPQTLAQEQLDVYVTPASHGGIADWELRMVARGLCTLFVKRTAETLENFLDLIDSLPDVAVRAEIAGIAAEAVASALAASNAAQIGSLAAALVAARRGLTLALTAAFDDTVVAHLYFSLEFKYAVYLPIGLPIIVPIMVAISRQTKHAYKLRKQAQQALEVVAE